MTRALMAGAVAATLADAAAFTLLIIPGRVAELNPLVAAMGSPSALAAKWAALAALLALAVAADTIRTRALRFTVAAGLVLAVAAGLIGAVSTIGRVL